MKKFVKEQCRSCGEEGWTSMEHQKERARRGASRICPACYKKEQAEIAAAIVNLHNNKKRMGVCR